MIVLGGCHCWSQGQNDNADKDLFSVVVFQGTVVRALRRINEEKAIIFCGGSICCYHNTSKHKLQQLEKAAVNRRLWQPAGCRTYRFSSVSAQACQNTQDKNQDFRDIALFGRRDKLTSAKTIWNHTRVEKAPLLIHLEYLQSASTVSFLSILTKIKAAIPFFSIRFSKDH